MLTAAADFAEVHNEVGKAYPFVAIDRTSKLAFAGLQPRATKMLAAGFLHRVLAAIPYKVHKVLTDNGTQFGNMPHQVYAWRHISDRFCDAHGIEHRFTKPAHPWTNRHFERFNRTLQEVTVKRHHPAIFIRDPIQLISGLYKNRQRGANC